MTLDAHAAQLSGLAILPFANLWEVYARLGVSFWWADADQAVYPYAGEFYYTRSQEDEGTSFLFGIGVGASPAPDWNVRFEYQSFPVDEDLLVDAQREARALIAADPELVNAEHARVLAQLKGRYRERLEMYAVG